MWVNGPKPATTIELWRTNGKTGADKIDEKVGEFAVPANASGAQLKKSFTKLAKHDSKGNEYEYYAKEQNVPENYKASYSADKLTVTNTYVKPADADKDNKGSKKIEKVKTGDSLDLKLYGGIGIFAVLIMILLFVVEARRKKSE